MMWLEILSDGFFAAVAAIGFGAISDPPMRAFPSIALLAAIGHALRFVLMHWGMDIASASLCASVTIGVGSLLLGGLKLSFSVVKALVGIIPVSLFFISLGVLCGSIFSSKAVGGICGALLTNLSAWLSGIWFNP